MPRKSMSLLCLAILASAGCGYKHSRSSALVSVDEAETNEHSQSTGYFAVPSKIAPPYARMRSAIVGDDKVFAASRYVAVRHKLEIVEPARDWRNPSKPWSRTAEPFSARCFRRV